MKENKLNFLQKMMKTSSGTCPTWHCVGGVLDERGSGRTPVLHNDTQEMAPYMANRVQAVALLVANSTCAVP